MGLFDDEVRDSFDEMFDLNRDGILDPIEQGFQLDFLTRSDIVDFYESDKDVDLDDLEYMDDDERREALEDAGYDPDDFDMDIDFDGDF